MKKKIKICIAVALLCFVGIYIFFHFFSYQKGDTVESQETILNRSIPSGGNWTVYNATYIDGYQISGAYNTNGKSAIVVFEPTNKGGYKLASSIVENNDEIIVSGAIINSKWYDLIWFNGAQTQYAEVTHTINGVTQEPKRFDTNAMQLITIHIDEKEYSWDVIYYDQEGNTYNRH